MNSEKFKIYLQFISDSEKWLRVKGHESKYLISSFGRVATITKKSFPMALIRMPQINQFGYSTFVFYKKGVKPTTSFLHRVVADHFIPNLENKPQINHIDRDRSNNKPNNLEWCTAKENITHSRNIIGNWNWTPPTKPICQINKVTGEIIAEFSSVSDAIDKLFNGRQERKSSIQKVAQGHVRTAYGYKWKYK